MALTTYTELKASMADWLNRSDLTAQIPDFISLAEAHLQRELRVRAMVARAVTNPGADEPYENLPGDFLQLKSLTFHSTPPKVPELRTSAWIRAYRRGTDTETGTPSFFAIEGSQLLFEKTPDTTQLEILYYQKIPVLVTTTNESNWVLDDHPDLYLFGALSMSAPFLKDDERIATWGGLFDRGIAALQKQDSRSELSASPMRATMKRVIG